MTRRKFLKLVAAGMVVVAAGIEVPAIKAAPPAKRKLFNLAAFTSLSRRNIAFQSGIALFLSSASREKNAAGGWDVTFSFEKARCPVWAVVYNFTFNPKGSVVTRKAESKQIEIYKTRAASMLIPIIESADSLRINYDGKLIGAMKLPSSGGFTHSVWLQDDATRKVYSLDP